MPIRTNRGRAAVYRRLWGWPLRSPRHLVMTIIGAIVIAVAIAVITQHLSGPATHSTAGAAPMSGVTSLPGQSGGSPAANSTSAPGSSPVSASTTTSTPPATRLATPPQTPVTTPAPQAALALIQTWGQQWVNHPVGMTNAQWLDQLRPYTTPEFLPVMGSVDVANINATQITGPPNVTHSYQGSVEALLPTNSGQLDITAIYTGQQWLVSGYTEAS